LTLYATEENKNNREKTHKKNKHEEKSEKINYEQYIKNFSSPFFVE